MGSTHVVAQGEHLTSIADQYGFTDYDVIWNHATNAQLKALRVNPNVLFPGDSLYIPDKVQKDESGATTKRHLFKLKQGKLMLRLVLQDSYEKPIGNAPCTLYLDQEKSALTSDGNGRLERELPANVTAATLVIGTEETSFMNEMLSISVGELDPVDTLTGQAARLNNLGYLAGVPENADDPRFESAVEEFQCEHALTVDGDPGPQTQSRLKQVHGC